MGGAARAFSEAVARGAHRLGAYKDEYEVARLLTDPELEDDALAQVPGATRLTYHLHPPALRSAGMEPQDHGWARRSVRCSRRWPAARALRGTAAGPVRPDPDPPARAGPRRRLLVDGR